MLFLPDPIWLTHWIYKHFLGESEDEIFANEILYSESGSLNLTNPWSQEYLNLQFCRQLLFYTKEKPMWRTEVPFRF